MTSQPGPFWTAPAELVIAMAPHHVRRQVDSRRAQGDPPAPHATVFRRSGKLWGVLAFKDRRELMFSVAVGLIENA